MILIVDSKRILPDHLVLACHARLDNKGITKLPALLLPMFPAQQAATNNEGVYIAYATKPT